MGYNKNRRDFEDDDYGQHHHTAKKKKEKRNYDDFESFGNASANKKCKQCALKHECNQSNAQRCKRFRKSRGDEWDD